MGYTLYIEVGVPIHFYCVLHEEKKRGGGGRGGPDSM